MKWKERKNQETKVFPTRVGPCALRFAAPQLPTKTRLPIGRWRWRRRRRRKRWRGSRRRDLKEDEKEQEEEEEEGPEWRGTEPGVVSPFEKEKGKKKDERSSGRGADVLGLFLFFFWFISNYKPEFHFHSSLLVEDNFIHMLDVGGVSSFHFYRGWLSILSISIKVESKLIPYHIIKVSVQLLVQSNSVKSIRIRSNLVKISQLQSKTQLSPKPY